MSERKHISPTEVIFRGFPDAMKNAARAVVRVRSIENRAGSNASDPMVLHIRERIAARITDELVTRTHHLQEQLRRQAARNNNSLNTTTPTDADDLFSTMFMEEATIVASPNLEIMSMPSIVRPQNIDYVLVDSDAFIRTQLFPRTFCCGACGHFIILQPEQPPTSLRCPCCQQYILRQEAIVFGCARCAKIQELVPPGRLTQAGGQQRTTLRQENLINQPIICPDCEVGHVHLDKHQSNQVARWQWVCTHCTFREDVKSVCLNCHLPKEGDKSASIIHMRSIPATAPSALNPLTEVQMFIDNDLLNPETLHVTAQKAGSSWSDYFDVKGLQGYNSLDKKLRSSLAESCIHNAYLLREVRAATTVFGYRPGRVLANRRTPVDPQEQLTTFFRDPERIVEYMCYGMQTHGAALVIEFDQKLIMQRFPNTGADTYHQLFSQERAVISNTPLRDLVNSEGINCSLFSALHGVEHALLTNAQRLLGSEALGSLCFFEQGIILLYEREPVGRGGVVQLVGNGFGLLDLIYASRDHVLGCAQGCIDVCPSCMYINDAACHYRSEDIGRSWLPGNVLLSRTGASRILIPTDYV